MSVATKKKKATQYSVGFLTVNLDHIALVLGHMSSKKETIFIEIRNERDYILALKDFFKKYGGQVINHSSSMDFPQDYTDEKELISLATKICCTNFWEFDEYRELVRSDEINNVTEYILGNKESVFYTDGEVLPLGFVFLDEWRVPKKGEYYLKLEGNNPFVCYCYGRAKNKKMIVGKGNG